MGGADARWSDLCAMAREAEAVGFDFVTILDHLDGHWEGWTMLSALAASTSQLNLVSYVSCTTYRNPALLARMADTLDEISDGRLVLGLGAGDSDTEHHHYGFPRDTPVSRFEEALTIIRRLLQDGHCDFHGEHYDINDCTLSPRGPSSSGPPIVIGSLGGRRLLRLAVQHADIWTGAMHLYDNDIAQLAPALERVDDACLRYGRDPSTLARMTEALVQFPGGRAATWTNMSPISGTPEHIAESLLAYQDLGISMMPIWIEPNTIEGIHAFAPVIDILRKTVSEPTEPSAV